MHAQSPEDSKQPATLYIFVRKPRQRSNVAKLAIGEPPKSELIIDESGTFYLEIISVNCRWAIGAIQLPPFFE